MLHSKVHIEAGDLVIIYMTRDTMVSVIVTPGEVFHNKFGRYQHKDMIGMKYGSKMQSPPPQSGYIHLLRPTPELWTLSLPHRTQILYMPDIAYILMRLGVRVGGKVIEAGTGSGSMTHSMARAVGPKGYVGSYEYHATRYEKAKIEFESHSLSNVNLQHRNVCRDGFGEVDKVEAVFLDLPAPWEAIPHAVKCLRPDMITQICCFSPCLEQVLKTVSTLREQGFSDISTQEVLLRTYELVPPPQYGSKHLFDISTIVSDLKDHETKKEARRAFQMRTARERAQRERGERLLLEAEMTGTDPRMEMERMMNETLAEDEAATAADAKDVKGGSGEKAAMDSTGTGYAAETSPKSKRKLAEASFDIEQSGETSGVKRQRHQQDTTTNADSTNITPTNSDPQAPVTPTNATAGPSNTTASSAHPEPRSSLLQQTLVKVAPEMRGHTSYLTFASYYPQSIREDIEKQALQSTSQPQNGSTQSGAGSPSVPPNGSKSNTPAAGVASRVDAKTGLLPPSTHGRSQAELAPTEKTDTEYGDITMEEVMGTLTEEEMVAMMANDTQA